MTKSILITGATDGIGLETAKLLVSDGHRVLLHGRNPDKLSAAQEALSGETDAFVADLSSFDDVRALADAVMEKHSNLDVLINNAGVFKTPKPLTADGLDVRFVVNAIAPYFLTRLLLPTMGSASRVVNVSSAAQAPVKLSALAGHDRLADMEAYAQSKLAITMWTREMAAELQNGLVFVAVNPGSLLASKMVKDGFGVAGGDLGIGAAILRRAALSDDFAAATGRYFDNDAGRFGSPHSDALDEGRCNEVVRAIEAVLANAGYPARA